MNTVRGTFEVHVFKSQHIHMNNMQFICLKYILLFLLSFFITLAAKHRWKSMACLSVRMACTLYASVIIDQDQKQIKYISIDLYSLRCN